MTERAYTTNPEGAARPWLQRKATLRIGAPDDACEREADRAADAVVGGRGLSNHGLSLSRIPVTQVQREDGAKPKSEEEKYKEAAQKIGEAFLETEIGKKLKQQAENDPLVKGAKEAGESFIGTLPGKIITGAAAAGAVAALAATHKELPAQIPEIPLDKITPGLKVKITYEGPVDNPSKAMITFSYTEQANGAKKPAKTRTELQREENARMALDQARFRAGLRYKPGTPEAKQQEAEEAALKRAAFSGVGKLPGLGKIDAFPALAPAPSALSMQFPTPSYGFKPKPFSLLDEELKLETASEVKEAQEQEKKRKEEGSSLQRKKDRGPGVGAVPSIVHDVVNKPGQPLDSTTRCFLESRFGYDLKRVRMHTGSHASASARAVDAKAYAWHHHVVMRDDVQDPTVRMRVLAHEIAHVIQQRAVSERADVIASPHSPLEDNAHGAVHAVFSGRLPSLHCAATAPLLRYRDTRLDHFLERFGQAAPSIRSAPNDEERVERLMQHFSGVDLTDPDNLGPVSNAVSRLMSEAVLFSFLQRIETDVRARHVATEELRMRRTREMMAVSRRPWGGYGPFPVTEAIGRTGEQATRGLSNSMAAFFDGLLDGLRNHIPDATRQALRSRLAGSQILNVVSPGVFAAGAVVGIAQDFWRALEGVWELITNFSEMMEQLRQLFEMLISPTGPAISRVFGRHVGQDMANDIRRLAGHNVFRFTFELGRIVGPTVVYAVLTVLGIGGAAIAARASSGLAQLLRRMPALMRIVERIGRCFRRVSRGALHGVPDAEIERALQHMEVPRVTGPRSRPRVGDRPVPTRRLPRLEADDIPLRSGERLADGVARIRRIIGTRISNHPGLLAAWNRALRHVRSRSGGPPSDPRRFFESVRDRFWRELRNDAAAPRQFSGAGFIFPDDARRAPQLGGVRAQVPRQEVTVSLDHAVEIRADPARAVDPDNLVFEFASPNTFREIAQMRHPSLRSSP